MMSKQDDLDGIVGPVDADVESKIRDFGELLKSIESLDDKKRQLWKEIYENAIVDRQNSYAMFTKLVRISGDKTAEHAVHGKAIATYIAGMSKANDQLIKLADLVARAQQKDDDVDPNAMFDRIKGG